MIVNRNAAQQALTALCLSETPDTVEVDAVTSAYRSMAKGAHPDHGGTLEAFANIDRSKHILLEWIKRRSPAPQVTGCGAAKCPRCNGKGFESVQRGFTALRVQCPMCKGNGDLNYDYDKGGVE